MLEIIRNKTGKREWDQQYRFHLLDIMEPMKTLDFRKHLCYMSA